MATQSNEVELLTPCPEFTLKSVDGKMRSLSDFASSEVLIVGFTCNHCPYVKAYEDRISRLASSFADKKVSILCINSNDSERYPEDSYERMIERSKERSFVFDYLHDPTQSVAKNFNAACTPEFFVYDRSRKLQYHGRLDDNTNEPTAVKERYLELAIEALLAGQKPKIQKTHALGCGIKWR